MGVTQHFYQEWVHIRYLSCLGIEDQYSVLGRFKKTAVTRFRSLQRLLRLHVGGHILKGQQDRFRAFTLLIDPAGVEKHYLVPYRGEYVVDLIMIEPGVCRKDVFKQLSEGGDIPLSVSKVEEELSYSLVGCYTEYVAETPVDRKHPQTSVEHHKGFPQCLDDRLGIAMVFLKCGIGSLTFGF